MTSIAGLYGYFSSLDRDGSGFLEKDEVECKFFSWTWANPAWVREKS